MKYLIEFDVPQSEHELWEFPQPKFKFMDRVAINNVEDASNGNVGIIVGMRLYYCRKHGCLSSEPRWEYNVNDEHYYPDNQWFEEEHLKPELEIDRILAERETTEEPEIEEFSVPIPGDPDYCEG